MKCVKCKNDIEDQIPVVIDEEMKHFHLDCYGIENDWSILTDEDSHDLENRLDRVIDDIEDLNLKVENIADTIRKIRNDIPCTCGNKLYG